MNFKTTIGLVVALLLAIGGVWWARSSSAPTAPSGAVGPKSLTDLKVSDITQYEIRSGTETVCAFTKVDQQWEMVRPFAGPAESATVNADVRRLADLKYTQVFSPGDADQPTADMTLLERPGRIVQLTDTAGQSVTLKIGARQMLSNKTYVQKEGNAAIYLVDADLNKDLKRKPSDYRSKRVSQFTTREAVRISVIGERNYTLSKQGADWTIESPVKARADTSVVNRLLHGLSNLNVSHFVKDSAPSLRPYGLENPRLVVTLTTEKKTPKPPPAPPASMPAEPEYEIERQTLGVAFGGGGEEDVFAKLDDPESRAVFQVAATALKDLRPTLEELRDKKIAVLPANREQGIKVLAAGAESIELAKEGTRWRITSGMEGLGSDTADFSAVSELLKAIRDIRAIGFEQTEISSFGFDRPRVTLEIAAEGRIEPVRLLVGNPTPSKTGAYIKNTGEDFIAVVPAADAEALVVEPWSFLDRTILTLDGTRATRVELERPGGVLRTVQRAGLGWQMTAPVTGNADVAAVTKILADLSRLRARRIVARAGDAETYGLQNPQARIRVMVDPPPAPTTQPAGEAVEEIKPPVIHSLRVNRHGGKVYAMKDGGATIGEIDAAVLSNLEAELLDTKVLALNPEQVRRLAFSGGDEFAFEKSGDDWKLMGESSFKTDASKVKEVLDGLRDLRVLRYERYSGADLARYRLDSPAFTLRVETTDGTSDVLMISPDGPSGGDRYACVSSLRDRVFVLKAADLQKFQKKISDFQKSG